MNIGDLTPAQKKALMKELEKEQREAEAKVTEARKAYKEKVDAVVPKLFETLVEMSEIISHVKTDVYNQLEALIEEKSEAYSRGTDQQSHSFSSIDGTKTITIGFRINDAWDDTVNVGIDKINDFIRSMGKNNDTRILTEAILTLLSKDAKGNLKASRVMSLQKMADEIQNPQFTDAIDIIRKAYKPIRTKQFVSVRYKDEKGNNLELPMSITDAPILITNTNSEELQTD